MRTIRRIGVGLVLAGGLVLLVPTGGYGSTDANRGFALEGAVDPNANLGLNYSGSTSAVALDSEDGVCVFFGCFYNDVALVGLEDNTAAGALTVSEITVTESGDVDTWGDGVRFESGPPAIGTVFGDFLCPASGGFFTPVQQESATSTVTVDVVVTGGNLTIDLTREIGVECVPD